MRTTFSFSKNRVMKISKQLSSIKPSYIREILATTQAPEMLSLAGGLPASELLPVDQLMDAITNLHQTPEVFQYGETKGYQPLLAFLSLKYRMAENQDAMICTGSQQAIDLIARAYLDPGDAIAMEAPSYLGALQVFDLAQANICSIKQTPNGPNLEELEAAFSRQNIKLFYVVPDFHNPTGVSWSLEVRKAVAKLCRDYNVGLIEDIPYRELRFSGESLPLVSSFCPEIAFVMRSFSKISAPGLRIGMVSAPKEWIAALIKIKQASDLHTSLPMQAVLLALLKSSSFVEHLNHLREHYRLRYQALYQALSPLIGEHCLCNEVDGGMFVWLRLLNAKSMDVTNALLEQNVAVVPGDVFYNNANQTPSALRLNFSHSSPQNLALAIERLGNVLGAKTN